MSDEQTYIKFAIADFTRVREYAAACLSAGIWIGAGVAVGFFGVLAFLVK